MAASIRAASPARPRRSAGWLAEVENDKTRGNWTNPALGRVRFSAWVGEWQDTTNNVRPTTAVRDRMLLDRYLLPRFGPLPLASISQRDVRTWVTELSSKGLAPATVHKCYQVLTRGCPGLRRSCGGGPRLIPAVW
jgi:hypothetical protein